MADSHTARGSVSTKSVAGRIGEHLILLVVGVPIGLVVGFFGGGIIGTVIAITTSHERAGWVLSEAGGYAAPVVVAVVVLARLVLTIARDEQKEVASARQTKLAAQQSRQDAAMRTVAELEQLRRALRETAQSAVDRFEQLPVLLRTATEAAAHAEVLFEQPSYSPFWEVVEESLAALGAYREQLTLIGQDAQRYVRLAEDQRLAGDPIAAFPITVDRAEATDAAAEVESRLQRSVARAHQDYGFSSIYEQRRNTATLVQGFSTLNAAVRQMSQLLHGAVSELRTDIDRTHHRIEGALRDQGAGSQQPTLLNEDRALTRQLLARVDACAVELHRLRTW
jgi:hypothetical protein